MTDTPPAQRATGIAGAADYHPAADFELRCWVCAGPLRSGGVAARCLPPLAIVCSEVCRVDPRYAGAGAR